MKVSNNFIVIGMGFGFWLILTFVIVYSLFFSGVINWNQDQAIFDLIQTELSKSVRPLLATLMWLVATILAIKEFIKLKKQPKYFTDLANDTFNHIPISTEIRSIKKEDVYEIKKSFFPLFGNRNKDIHISHLFLILVIPVSQFIFFILYLLKVLYWSYLKLFTKEQVKFLLYSFIIVSKNQSDVININILSENDYRNIDDYLYKHFNLKIKNLPINKVLVKSKGVNDGK